MQRTEAPWAGGRNGAAEQVEESTGGWSLRGAGGSRSLLSPQYGKKKLKYLPYNHQHEYFFLSECWDPLPPHPDPLLTPVWPSVSPPT